MLLGDPGGLKVPTWLDGLAQGSGHRALDKPSPLLSLLTSIFLSFLAVQGMEHVPPPGWVPGQCSTTEPHSGPSLVIISVAKEWAENVQGDNEGDVLSKKCIFYGCKSSADLQNREATSQPEGIALVFFL